MSNIDTITELAQDIYLVKNDEKSDATGTELTKLLSETVMYANQWLGEVELEADWNWVRENDVTLGTIASTASRTVPLTDATIRKLVTSPYRPLTLSHDGAVIATFNIVEPNQIANPANFDTHDRVTVIGRNLIFSRNFTDLEVGATITADVIHYLTPITNDATFTDISVLAKIHPRQLLVLGVAKNSTLPNVIQGQLSPSYVQKYNDLLSKAIAENNATSDSYEAEREDFSFIGGLY